MRKPSLAYLLGLALLVLCAGNSFAAHSVTVAAATGGSAISADSIGGSWTLLTGPVAAEGTFGDIGTGTIILTAPGGFLFNTNAAVTVKVTAGSSTAANNINHIALNGTFGATVAANVP